jgi:hypothetical protein
MAGLFRLESPPPLPSPASICIQKPSQALPAAANPEDVAAYGSCSKHQKVVDEDDCVVGGTSGDDDEDSVPPVHKQQITAAPTPAPASRVSHATRAPLPPQFLGGASVVNMHAAPKYLVASSLGAAQLLLLLVLVVFKTLRCQASRPPCSSHITPAGSGSFGRVLLCQEEPVSEEGRGC